MSAEKLRLAGEALYGPRWQTDVATLLCVDSRRVRAWLANERPIPEGVWRELARELRRRAASATRIADQII